MAEEKTNVPAIPLTFLSPQQAIDVWADLEDAYRGKHGYGGDVAEIYAYRLGVLTPTVAAGNHEGPFGKPAFDKYCMQAGEALIWLCEEFKKRRKCKIVIEVGDVELPLEKLREEGGLGHRIHIKVKPRKEKE